MKGKKIFTINGKDVTFSLDMGALEDFQEYLISNGEPMDIGTAVGRLKNVRYLLHFMSGSDESSRTPLDEFRTLPLNEMNEIMALFDLQGGKGKATG
jgi:hypothetical protein